MTASFDLVIREGMVLDGTGSPSLKKDVGIVTGKMKRIGNVAGEGRKTIDASGMVVSPGFVDLHTHADLGILAYPDAENYIMQGVTTVVVGNCGLSMAPLKPDKIFLLKRYISPYLEAGYDYGWQWGTLAEYYVKVAEQGTSVNLAPLVGQGAIRLAVKGFDTSEATKEEMKEMKKLLAQSLDDGAFGMSTGLVYPPGSYSSTEELVELASILTECRAIYTTHIRNEGERLIEGVEEAIRIGEEDHIPVEISHHKAAGRSNWGKIDDTLGIIGQARQRGVEVNFDVYPYPAGSTTVTALLPLWVLEGGIEKMLARLKDKKVREAIEKESTGEATMGINRIEEAGWHSIFIGSCPSQKKFEGKSLEEILKERDEFDNPYQGLFDWLLEIEGDATMVVFDQDEGNVKTVLSSPLASVASDSWVTAPAAGGKPHPRSYGTFPRVLGRYVREEKLLALEEAVRKMTSLPAGKIGLEGRGIIKEGCWADIVIFAPAAIKDRATFASPHQYPEGISHVIVNGQVVVDQGELTGARPGKVLKR